MRPDGDSTEVRDTTRAAADSGGPRPATSPIDPEADGTGAGRADLVRPEVLVAVAVAVGVMLRVLQYGADRSLWLDEVLMVPAIVRPSFLDLLSPGSWNHLPPGFLFVEKLLVTALGEGDLALRLLPFLGGIGALFVFLGVAKRLVTPTAAPVAVGLFAVSPFLVYYTSELKPYSTDVLATTVLLLIVGRILEAGITPKRVAFMGVAGVVAAGFSLTSVFVSVGAVAGLLVAAARSGDRAGVRALTLTLAGWAVVFGAPYVLFVHGTATNDYAREFWRSGFMPFPPRSLEELAWLPRTVLQVFRDPLGVFSDEQSASGVFGAGAALVAFAAGCVWMARHASTKLLVLTAPILVTLFASALMLYPFGGSRVAGGRVLLFLTPVFFLVMAEGAAWAWKRFRGDARIVPVALLALLLGPALIWGAVAVPVPRTEVKPLLEYLEEEVRPGDVVYVHYDVRHAFEHYASDYALDEVRYLPGVCARGEPSRYLDAIAALRGAPRAWILFGNGRGTGLFDEKAISIDYLEHVGDRLDDQVTFGASLYLYDLRPEAADPTPYRAQLPVVPLSIADDCALWN